MVNPNPNSEARDFDKSDANVAVTARCRCDTVVVRSGENKIWDVFCPGEGQSEAAPAIPLESGDR